MQSEDNRQASTYCLQLRTSVLFVTHLDLRLQQRLSNYSSPRFSVKCKAALARYTKTLRAKESQEKETPPPRTNRLAFSIRHGRACTRGQGHTRKPGRLA